MQNAEQKKNSKLHLASLRIVLLKAANLLTLESPVGIGWSYAVDGNINTTDEQVRIYRKIYLCKKFKSFEVRDDCFRALLDFFTKFPKYTKNELYLAGLSYAGVYIPMLAAKIVSEQMTGRFPTNLTVSFIFGYL